MASSTRRSVAARSVASLLLALALLAAAAVSAQAAGSVYVGNWGNDSLTQFPLDTTGGLFAFGAATVDSGTQPMQVAVSPDGDSVYAVGGSGVWEYDVNHATGALTAKRVAPLLAADQVGQGIAVSPDGKHVYVSSIVTSSFSGFLSTFDVDATDGTLTFTSSRSSVLGILGLAVSPDGKRLIAAGANQVLQYDLDAAGVPTAKTAVNLGGTPRAAEVVISPDSASAYVSDLGNSGVFELNISPVNGALSGKSPGFVRAGSGAIGIARSADGRSVYVTNQNGNSITQFDVGSGGLLTAKPAGAVAAPGGPQDIALSRDGATAYVANSDGTISQYDVDPVSGALAVKAPVVTPGAPSAGHSNSMFGIATGIYPNAPSARSSSTSVSCPDAVVGVATTCTATVTDASDAPTAPVGTVSFDNGMTCTLSGTGAAPGCSIQVTPTAIGTTSLTASYGGDTIHRASQSSADFVTRLATSTTLTCSPTSFTLNASTSCTATVTDTSAAPTAPDGTVSVEGTTCALTADASGDSASCSLDKTPASAGDHDLAADYSGSATHAASSSDPVTISVAKRTDTVALSCSPDSVAIHASTTCTATVSDTDAGTASAPDGTITLTRAACDDRFVGFCSRIDVRVGSCALAPDTGSTTASCAVDDTPSAVGPEELTARYSGATHADAASDPATVTVVKRATTAVADCPTATVPVNTVARCTVTVTDVDAGAKSAPRGFVANPHHELWIRPDGWCVLVPDTGGTSSSCSFDIAQPYLGPLMAGQFPGFPGSPVAVDYEPEPFSTTDDPDHARSSVTLSMIFGERATATAVACDPSAPAVGQATTCTATVSDDDGDGASAPDGTVGFSSAGGSFSAASCTPVADAVDPTASCAVQYTPDAAGDHIVTAALTGATKHFDSSGSTTVSVPAPCTRSGATLNVRLGSGAATLSRATDGTLQLGASPCADATTSNVGTIDVTGAGGDDDVTLDLSGGGFGGARVAVDLGEGDDTLTVAGGDGQDSMRLGDAGLAIAGQSAAFVTLSGVDHVRLDGNGAHDTISAAGSSATGAPYSGRVIINGGAGADVLTGGTNGDYIDGGADADNITGGAGDDIEHGGDGNDVFPSGSVADGTDQLIGDGGVDRADYSSRRAGVAVTLNGGSADGAAGEGDDVRTENATGGAGADALTGDGGANTLTGGGGADTLDGAGSGDTLAGGAGNDLEHGGDGNDVFPEDAAANGADQLHGDAGIDKVSYAARAAKVTVTLDAAANDGADGEGDDAEAENIDGGKGDDDVTGDGLANTLVGNAGADVLRGMGGNDTLTGGTGADSLLGGEGADILDGTLDADADTCDGGPGANRIKNCP